MTTEVIEPPARGRDLPASWPFSPIVGAMQPQDLGANKWVQISFYGAMRWFVCTQATRGSAVFTARLWTSVNPLKEDKNRKLKGINSYQNQGVTTGEMKAASDSFSSNVLLKYLNLGNLITDRQTGRNLIGQQGIHLCVYLKHHESGNKTYCVSILCV